MSDEIAIGHLQKRKIEAGVLIPFIAACREKFGDAATREAVAATIRGLAAEEGAKWAGRFGGDVAGLRAAGRDGVGRAAAAWTSRSSTRRTTSLPST